MNQSSEITDLVVKKSNNLVSATYNSTLMENLLILVALGRIQEKTTGTLKELSAELYPSELKQIVSDPKHIYRDLDKVSDSMLHERVIHIKDDKGNFTKMAFITQVDYKNGVFKIVFNNKLEKHIISLEQNFTTLELSILSSFKTNAAFRIYELLKSERGLELFRRKKEGKPYEDEVICEFGISELKFMIGLANSSSEEARSMIDAMSPNIDWDIVYEKLDAKDKKYDSYPNFRRRVLEPAQKELKEKSNISFEFEPVASSGKKYNRIRFFTHSNEPTNPKIIDERAEYIKKKFRQTENQMEIPYDLELYADLFDTYVGHNKLAAEDIRLFLDDCGGDKEIVKKAIIQADEQENIHNYVGWIRECVKNGGYNDTAVINGSKNRADRASDMVDKIRNVPEGASFQERLWSRKVDEPEYSIFSQYLEAQNIELKDFNTVCTVEERLIIYKAIINGDKEVIKKYRLQERLWSRKVDEPEYSIFSQYLEAQNIELKDFNTVYTVEERLIIYKAIIHGNKEVIKKYGLPT